MRKGLREKVILVLVILIIGVSIGFIRGEVKINGYVFTSYKDIDKNLRELENKNRYFVDDELENKFVVYKYDTSILINKSKFSYYIDKFFNRSFNIDSVAYVKEDKLKEYLNDYNSKGTPSKSAYIMKNENNKYVLVNEIIGTVVDIDAIMNNLKEGSPIDLKDYVVKPELVYSDLEDTYNKILGYANWSVQYTNGKEIRANSDCVSLNESGEVIYNTDFIENIYKDVISSYETVGIPRDFKTNGGSIIQVSGGSWGSTLDYDKELEFLLDNFKNAKSITGRTPIFIRNQEDFGDTYIEVSIADQHLWYYKDGHLEMESGVVTGLPNGKRDTPTGCYFISECIDGKYLTGDGYRTWVDKWMRLTNTGIGLHDAGWQSSFGGTRYLRHGSHGCINLPVSFAYDLFKVSYVGMPVIIY